MKRPLRVAIIGGGISGLSTAWFLEQQLRCDEHFAGQAVEIELFESNDRLGGKIQTHRQDGLIMELGAESFLSRKPHGMALCQDLGILDRLQGTRPDTRKTFVWWQDRLHALPEGLSGFVPAKLQPLLKTSLLSPLAKARFLLEYFLPPKKSKSDNAECQEESIASFISRRLGRQTYQRLVQPLLCGIYCGDGEQLSLRAAYPELQKLEQEHGSLLRGLKRKQAQAATSEWPAFVTFSGGMSDLIEAVAEQLQSTTVTSSAAINEILPVEQGYQLNFAAPMSPQSSDMFDTVIATTSSRISSKLLANADSELANELAGIPHVSTMAVNLWYEADQIDHDLDGYGFVVPSQQQRGVTAVTWTSSKHFHRVPEGLKLIRVYLGRAGDEADLHASDETILKQVDRELRRMMNLTTTPKGYFIHRWFEGSPQYCLGHLDRLERVEKHLTQLPGLFLTGSSYRGVGIPDCIRQAKEVAAKSMDFLSRRTAC